MTTSNPKTERVPCNKCGRETKHELIAERIQHGAEPYDEDYELSWNTTYELFECCGCEDVTLRRSYFFSEWNPGDVEIIHYPPRIARQLPPWTEKLSMNIRPLLKEVYTALQADSHCLAMMGARTLIDMVIDQRVGDVGNFGQKLQALEDGGFLSKKHREVLEAALDVGSAAAHRGHKPKSKHVEQVMDIVENLLHTTTFEDIDELKAATPQRKKAKKNKPNTLKNNEN